MADKFRYSFDLTKEFEEQLKQGMLAAEQRDVTSSPGMMSADPPAQRLEEANQSKYDPYSFIKDYKDMLFGMFGGEEEYNKVIAEQDARLPEEEDALKKATGTYIGIIDLPPLPPVDMEQLEPYDKGEQPEVRKDVEETLQSIQIEETLNEVEKETSQQGLMSPLAPSESLRPKARPEDVNPTLKKSSAEYELFDKIVGGESDDFNTIFRNSKIQTPKPLTEMTVGEVRAWQDKSVAAGSKSSAVGRFQIIRKTMDTLLDNKVLSLDDVFNEETQTKAYRALLERRGYSKIKDQIQAAKSTSKKRELAQKLQNNLAMEFASIPVATAIPKGRFGTYPLTDLVPGDTFYKDPEEPKLNKAQHKSEDFLSILMKL